MNLPSFLALALLLSGPVNAQNPFPGGPRSNAPQANGSGVMTSNQGFAVPFFYPEREVVYVIEKQAPPPPAAVPLPEQAQGGAKPPPRKPYVVGASYASLPSGCMKMVEAGGTYFYCGGEWYRQVGGGYKAVKEP